MQTSPQSFFLSLTDNALNFLTLSDQDPKIE
jgi:hypothetical protein